MLATKMGGNKVRLNIIINMPRTFEIIEKFIILL
tara:strand:- start:369 stop:470 length:102 start_codon:yes stop_codon:yes gene_type:complete